MAERDRGRPRRPTMHDVARHARVSIGTVSHVLNSSKKASIAATAAVNEAVSALGYHPNSVARSLSARRVRKSPERQGERPRLVTIGYVSIDYMVSVDTVPMPGARMTSRGIEKMLGGPAANVAAFAASLRPRFDVDVEILSHIGIDADSEWALEELSLRGVDASGTRRQSGGRLSRCIVLVDAEGERTILNEPLQVPVELVLRHLAPGGGATRRSCMHFDGYHLSAAEKAHDSLRAKGHILSLHSAGLAPSATTREGCKRLMAIFDLLVLDRGSFARITTGDPDLMDRPETLFDLAPDGPCGLVILTRGSEGAVLLRRGEAAITARAPPTHVVDATGAGDALTGVFLGSWLSQGDPVVALSDAVRAASLSLQALGAQGGLVTAAQPVPTEKVAEA